MKIVFVLPNSTDRAIGGYKVVYEYANFLNKKGHYVEIVYDNEQMIRAHSKIFAPFLYFRAKYFAFAEPKWFPLHKQIKKSAVAFLRKEQLESFDVVVATAKITAEYVHNVQIDPSKVLYFVQDFENWGCSEESVYKTYAYGYKPVAISQPLVTKINQYSPVRCGYVPDGIDTSIFCIKNAYANRPRHSIALMYRNSPRKGYAHGLQVLLKLKEKYPDLECVVFGVDERPINLPQWAKYYCKATPEQVSTVYNSVRVYLSPSLQEGFGLTGLESMACGCVLVSTDTQGVHEYATDGENAKIVPIGDVERMYQTISDIYENDVLGISISKKAVKTAQEHSVEKMAEKFEAFLQGLIK